MTLKLRFNDVFYLTFIVFIFFFIQETETPSKALSRSSSIRSIPSTPALSRQHPLPELQARAKSPAASPGRSPAHRASHSKERNSKKSSPHYSYQKKESTPSPVSKLYTFTTVNDSFGNSPIGKLNQSINISEILTCLMKYMKVKKN